ncbi:MAG: hypothetical protein JWL93_1838 [Hyphomicrobiales bacterium]|jgi:hypothetical protein|nr:hypothetical protein [Hyphomicrobiales bacterium]MDB5596472.1 hypothetical protein [Hyphomicrobiales bacterium]
MSPGDNPGLVGALLGLCLGVAEYVIVLRMIGAAVGREARRDPANVDFEGFGARMRPIRIAMLVGAFAVLPAVGYVAGRTLL